MPEPPFRSAIDRALAELRAALPPEPRVVVLTGAGISAESGIRTFRGEEGYWTVGSRVYRPMELATWSAFQAEPTAAWGWYLYRHRVCSAAQPNAAHRALVEWERAWGERFQLVTQNVDGLHARAGSRDERTFCVHGRIDRMRCAGDCAGLVPTPDWPEGCSEGESLPPDWVDRLHCTRCGGWMRPHVLWFDEYYDEDYYRMESSLTVTASTDLLVTVGSSGATNLPMRMAMLAHDRGIVSIDINPESNPFAEFSRTAARGLWIEGTASEWVPRLVEAFVERR